MPRSCLMIDFLGRLGLSQRADDVSLQGEDSLLQTFDAVEYLPVALEQFLVLAVADVAFGCSVLKGESIPMRLAVTGQQDQRRGICRLRRERQIEQDEWKGVERPCEQPHIRRYPQRDDDRLDDDERPAAHERGHTVGDPLPRSRLVVVSDVGRVAEGATESLQPRHRVSMAQRAPARPVALNLAITYPLHSQKPCRRRWRPLLEITPSGIGRMTDVDAAWDERHDATPLGWYVGEALPPAPYAA